MMARQAARISLAIAACAAAPVSAQTTAGPIEISGVNDARCRLTLGDVPVDIAGDAGSVSVPVAIECNMPFSLHARAARGTFLLGPAPGSDEPPEPVGYRIEWPAGMVDRGGSPIGGPLNAIGEQWQAGITAASDATRTVQQGVMLIRLDHSPAANRIFQADAFILQIEPN